MLYLTLSLALTAGASDDRLPRFLRPTVPCLLAAASRLCAGSQRQTLRQSGLQRYYWQAFTVAQWFGRPLHGAPVKPSPVTDTSLMTRVEVAAWLKVRPRQVERLGVPCIALGRKTVRYLRADVLEWLERQRGRQGSHVRE